MNSKPKMETSKKIILALFIPAYILIGFTVVATFMGYETSSFVQITECLIGASSVGVGFYYWKAKAENLIKISKSIPEELKDKIDINNIN